MRLPAATPLPVRFSARQALGSTPSVCCGSMTSGDRPSRSADSARAGRNAWLRRARRGSWALRSDTKTRAVAGDCAWDDSSEVSAHSIGEIDRQVGHRYLPHVHHLDTVRRRRHSVGLERKVETPDRYFKRTTRVWDGSQRRMLGTILDHYDVALTTSGNAIQHGRVFGRLLARFVYHEIPVYLVNPNARQVDAGASTLRRDVLSICGVADSDDRHLAHILGSPRLAMGGSRLQ